MDSLHPSTDNETDEAPWRTLAAIRATRPLVHNITSTVVANFTANALLALGASPAMADLPDEVEEMVAAAGALVVNLGTVSPHGMVAMRRAARKAGAAGTPWILDPVAAGALGARTRLARELIAAGPAVIRGNASEILALTGAGPAGKGVDSAHAPEEAVDAAVTLARASGAVVAVTGPVDLLRDGSRRARVTGGHAMMPRVTGMGCAATALIGACLAVEADPFAAASHGLALTAIAGELAGASAAGPGSFQVAFLDRLHGLDRDAVVGRKRIG